MLSVVDMVVKVCAQTAHSFSKTFGVCFGIVRPVFKAFVSTTSTHSQSTKQYTAFCRAFKKVDTGLYTLSTALIINTTNLIK